MRVVAMELILLGLPRILGCLPVFELTNTIAFIGEWT
jgi:hypothetical protein